MYQETRTSENDSDSANDNYNDTDYYSGMMPGLLIYTAVILAIIYILGHINLPLL